MKKIRFVPSIIALFLVFCLITASAGAVSYSSGNDSIFYPPVFTTYPTPTPTPIPTPAPTPTPISDVFLLELINAGPQIRGYNWQNSAIDSQDGITRQVAFCDVTGDGVPELLTLRMAQNGSSCAEIRIGTYNNGTYREIYNFDQLDSRTGTHTYCFFQLKGDNALYAYLNDPSPYNNAKFYKLSSHSNGTFDGRYLMGMTASSWQTQYTTTYGTITESQFNSVMAQQLLPKLDKIVFSGHMRSDGVFVIPAGITNISVTYEQAVSALVTRTNLTSYYTVTDGKSTGTAAQTPVPQITPAPPLPTAQIIIPYPTSTPYLIPTPVPTPVPTPQTIVIPPTSVPYSSWSSAYKSELTGNRNAIAKYTWQNGYAFLGDDVPKARPIAITDFTGDGQPDMLYVASSGGNGAVGDSAQLKICTYSNGLLQEIYSAKEFDKVSQAFPEYLIFRIYGDDSLYLYESTMNAYAGNYYFYKLNRQTNGQLVKKLQFSATTSGVDTFQCKNANGQITLQEFYIGMKQLTDNIREVLLSGHLRDTFFSIPSSASDLSLTYDEAIAMLK